MHLANLKRAFALSIIFFTVFFALIPPNKIYAQTTPANASGGAYKYDILAREGHQGLRYLYGSPSINDNGAAAFIGTSEGVSNYSLFFSDNPGAIREVGRGYRFSEMPQINNSNQIVTSDVIYGSPWRTYIRRWNANSSGSSVIVAEGAESGITATARFQSVWERPSINNNNQVAFSALANYPTYDPRLATGLDQTVADIPMPGGFGANGLRPMIADNGRLAVMAGDWRYAAPIRLYNLI